MSKIYFAHSINDYDTEYEKECIKKIYEQFPDSKIINPHTDIILKGNPKFNGFFPYMEENFFNVINTCNILIYSKDNNKKTITRGVMMEIEHAKKIGISISEIRDE